jgi:hypothetical protein
MSDRLDKSAATARTRLTDEALFRAESVNGHV